MEIYSLSYKRSTPVSESYYKNLERSLRTLEDEQKRLIKQKNTLQKQLEMAKSEITKLTREPLLVGTLGEVLEGEQAIVRSSNGPSFIVNISPDINLADLVPGKRVILNQRTLSLVKVISSAIDPLVKFMEVDERPKETYKDIGGLEEQILELTESIELSLKSPELFEKVGIESPKGVLLYGPPGSGKTLLAKALAHETNATFISITGSELVQKYIGEGARIVRELFQYAHNKTPSIIFIDEIDAIGSKRLDIATGGDREVQRTFMQLLAEMDGFTSRGNVKVIGATNRVDVLDEALLRPGRFDRHIEIPLPNKQGRTEIFRIHIKKMSLDKGVQCEQLADLTEGLNFSGAEIKALVIEAGIQAIRQEKDSVSLEDFIIVINKAKKQKESGTSIIHGFYE